MSNENKGPDRAGHIAAVCLAGRLAECAEIPGAWESGQPGEAQLRLLVFEAAAKRFEEQLSSMRIGCMDGKEYEHKLLMGGWADVADDIASMLLLGAGFV